MYAENELLFPHHLISALRNLRGTTWQDLIDQVLELSPYHEEALAFSLMMFRLNGCVPCETDSFRAMRGCLPCAAQTLRRYKGSDDDLMTLYEQALREVRQFAVGQPRWGIIATMPELVPM